MVKKWLYLYLVLIVIPATFLSGCTKVNLVSLPPAPPESHLPPKTDFTLFVDTVEINADKPADQNEVKTNFQQYLNQARYFSDVLDYENMEATGKTKSLIVRSVITPKESHQFNWWVTWPAIYPMPFYWPFQPKKGEISVAMDSRVYDHTGDLVAHYEAYDSHPFSVTFYGFFHNGNARAILGACYKSVFEHITTQLTSDKRIIALTQRAPSAPTPRLSPQPEGHDEPVIPAINFGNYYALVIGINNYPNLTPLKTAVNDARAVSDILSQKYGFKVTRLTNPGRSEIISALGSLRRKLTRHDNLLIYYAGHGWLDNKANEGYWLPADSSLDDESNWISNSTITASIRANEAKHVLVVADSCYSGKLTRAIHINRKIPGYIKRLCDKKARVAMASGGLEPVEDNGNGDHSVFATEFINILKKNDSVIEGTEVFSQLRRPVMLNADQTPEYGDIRKAGHDGGDFLFISQQ